MESPGTVYVVQDSGDKNFTPALQFGHIQIVATRDWPMFQEPTSMKAHIREMLTGFNAEKDYLLLTGDPITIGWCMFHLLSRFGTLRCLKFDRQTRSYNPVTIGK